ncbi:Xaa-Pro peptidase family protein [Methyloligella sp. 2.7D]|uniref:M24 family metallopeptidase n=1 Tax=unclassified Methyloligella TaxID=2625955 RepID=UPI00157BDEE0|nr:Xaa-Pro peptidase family protein [Methyloligella sp. GL2]QKP76002.1 aminopeptidase P family protein [Methyloligella sp. GL2]
MDLVSVLQESPLPRELPFTEAEYAERVQKVQKKMVEQGVDFLLISNTPNLCYLTGYDTCMSPGYTIGILGTTGDVILHASELEATCAMLMSNIKDIRVFYWYEAQDTATQLAEILKGLGAEGKTIGLEMGYAETFASGAFDTKSYLKLASLLPTAKFYDATRLVLDVRLIKTAKELDYMRKAGEYTAIGLEASIAAVTEGATDTQIAGAGYGAMVSAGSELMSIDPMIATGKRAAYMPHAPYKRIPVAKGEAVYLEYSGCYHRYNAPSMRSAVVGTPPDGTKRLADASIKVVELLLENIKPGRTGDDVAKDAQRGLDDAPEGTYFHGGFGYSIGMGFQPTWTENPVYISPGSEDVLQPGMTFHLPICVWVPSDKYGLGFSESVAVTETGCEVLTPGKDRVLAVR